MIRIRETARTITSFQPVPLTDMPLLYQRDHHFSYTSYGDQADVSIRAPLSRAGRQLPFCIALNYALLPL